MTQHAGTTEHVDVLIVGAGLSGIGAAQRIQHAFPGRSYTIFEARDASGGTWDLFRYPGVRSDSDMHTLGYRLRPWKQDQAIADGSAILRYIRDTAAEAGVDRHIRFGHRVVRAEWSSNEGQWTVEASHSGGTTRVTADFLYVCTGYYRYEAGHTPEFPGVEHFGGTVVHPQRWPEDLDYTGSNVVVIGSGATAVTLVPAMAEQAAHVTLVQRSPTYIVSLPTEDAVANRLHNLLGSRLASAIVRWKNVLLMTATYQLSRRRPALVRSLIRRATRSRLPRNYPVDTHFNPRYDPWDQRLCVVPDGDLFTAIRHGHASMVTDGIREFTPTGLRLSSGAEIDADIVVTATGLSLLPLGGIDLTVDGQDVALPDTTAYKGLMLSGVPNLAFTVGYFTASWTLKADLVAEYVVRLLRHMDARGYSRCVPVKDDPEATDKPLIDFDAGYVQRSIHHFPRQGSRDPWRFHQNYLRDMFILRHGRIDDGHLRFSRRDYDDSAHYLSGLANGVRASPRRLVLPLLRRRS